MKTSCKLLIAFASLFVFGSMSAAEKQKVDFVHPLHWFSGMKETKFQVLIHGDNIAAMNPEVIGTQSIVIDKVVKVENPNYLILYLDTKGAEPQTFNIRLTEGKKKLDIPYQLKPKADYNKPSFSSADVLYLLMPDRFANGNPDNDQIKGMRETLLDPNEPMARHGGDLRGMTDKLDYLQQLGVTAVWPTPLQENDRLSPIMDMPSPTTITSTRGSVPTKIINTMLRKRINVESKLLWTWFSITAEVLINCLLTCRRTTGSTSNPSMCRAVTALGLCVMSMPLSSTRNVPLTDGSSRLCPTGTNATRW